MNEVGNRLQQKIAAATRPKPAIEPTEARPVSEEYVREQLQKSGKDALL